MSMDYQIRAHNLFESSNSKYHEYIELMDTIVWQKVIKRYKGTYGLLEDY